MNEWHDSLATSGKSFWCGYCGTLTSPREKYASYSKNGHLTSEIDQIFICTGCNRPTFFEAGYNQFPGPMIGKDVKYVPEQIEHLYNEARNCFSINAYTSTVLACRKILMNVAVQEGAAENKKFVEYVNYLEENGYIPPKGRSWVDKIRTKGNEATHEISPMDSTSAKELISFIEMLLIYTYEFPGTVNT